MTNNPIATKYESFWTNNLRGVAFIKYTCNYIENAQRPITPTKIVGSKWWDNMINYTHYQM
jgi:hypothetical protein